MSKVQRRISETVKVQLPKPEAATAGQKRKYDNLSQETLSSQKSVASTQETAADLLDSPKRVAAKPKAARTSKAVKENDAERAAHLQLLKSFDLDYAYGPCLGLSRKQRYERAVKAGLHPPSEVIDILNQYPDTDGQISGCLWAGQLS